MTERGGIIRDAAVTMNITTEPITTMKGETPYTRRKGVEAVKTNEEVTTSNSTIIREIDQKGGRITHRIHQRQNEESDIS